MQAPQTSIQCLGLCGTPTMMKSRCPAHFGFGDDSLSGSYIPPENKRAGETKNVVEATMANVPGPCADLRRRVIVILPPLT